MPELGEMPVGVWRASDLVGKICCHLGVLLVAVFWRSELTAASYFIVDSINKALVCGYLLICYGAVLFLLPVGLGGEGKGRFGEAVGGSGGWRGCSSVPAQWRGAGRSWTRFSQVPPRWKTMEKDFGADSLNKRCHLSIGSLFVMLFLLAGHGGKGKDQDDAATCISGDCGGFSGVHGHPCALEAVVFGGVDQRRPCFANVIPGQRGHSALGCCASPSSFFLQATLPLRRILDLGARVSAIFTPSGFVPGGVDGARALRSWLGCGEEHGPNCFSSLLLEVLFEICEDQIVISYLFGILTVILYSPLL